MCKATPRCVTQGTNDLLTLAGLNFLVVLLFYSHSRSLGDENIN
jgi:hypothetical protein